MPIQGTFRVRPAHHHNGGPGHGFNLDLPDDFKVTDRFWLDLQDELIKTLQEHAARGEVHPQLAGIDGFYALDPQFKDRFKEF